MNENKYFENIDILLKIRYILIILNRAISKF